MKINFSFKKLCTFVSIAFFLIVPNLVLAGDNDIPIDMQTSIFLKTIPYCKTLNSSKINIGVVFDPSSSSSVGNKDKFIENANSVKASLSDKPISLLPVNISSFDSAKDLSVLYLTKGIPQSKLSKLLKSVKSLTWGSDPNYVKTGNVSISVINKNNRPKLIVSLKNLKQEGHTISSNLLKLTDIID